MQLFNSPLFRSFDADQAQNDAVFVGPAGTRYGRRARQRPVFARTFGHSAEAAHSAQAEHRDGPGPDEEEISRYDAGHAA